MKPKLLDLFCGAGGATKGLQRAGFYVVGVDMVSCVSSSLIRAKSLLMVWFWL